VTDSVYCLVKIIQKDERIFAAVQFEIKLFDFFYRSKRLTDYIYTDVYCKPSKCVGQTLCSYKHYLVVAGVRAILCRCFDVLVVVCTSSVFYSVLRVTI